MIIGIDLGTTNSLAAYYDGKKARIIPNRLGEHLTPSVVSVDDDGMTIRVDLDTENNAEARSLYSAVERGDITGMSFMFTVDKDTWIDPESEHPTRRIANIGKVFEVSAVTFPAYQQTSISARGMDDALEGARTSLESVKAEMKAIEDKKKKISILLDM